MKKKIFLISGIILSVGVITAAGLFFILRGRNKGGNEETTAAPTKAAESTSEEESTTPPATEPEREPGIQAKLTLSADCEEAAEGGAITYTAEIDHAPESDIKVMLSSGETITIKAGETQGSVTVDVRSDDPYKQGDEIVNVKIADVTQDSTKSGIENIVFDDTPVKTVVTDGSSDGTNDSIVTLSVSNAGVTEGAVLTYTVSINNTPRGNVAVTLSSGRTLTIKGGETRSSVTAAVRADDAYKQGAQTVSVRITGVTQDTAEDGLENVTFGPAAVSTVVNDNGTSSKVSLKADVSDIVEGKSITYTASIGSAPKNSIQVFLSNGKTITIYSGQKSGSLKVDARKDDFYKQGKETLTLKITGITQDSAQDGLESVSYDSSAVRTTVSDDEDEAKVTLHVDKIAAFEGTELTYTAEIDNAPKGILIVTLDNGKTIMIKAGKTCGTLKTKIRKDDVYKQGDETLEVKIKKVSPDSTKDGLEKITFDTKAVSTKIYDDDDASKVTLSVDQENAVEGEKLTYTAEIDNAPKSDVTVTLDNGETITIKADETSGTVTVDTREDDAYKQGDETVEAKITKVIQDSAKDGLEKVTFDNTAVKTTVKDDESISTVTLSVDKESAKEGETLTYTAEIDKAPKSDVTVTLDNGETITIKADEASGTVTVDTREDDLYKQDDETLTVQITAVTPDNAEDGLENVAFDDASVSTVVADDSDVSTVKVKVCQSEETEDGKWICTAEVDHAPQTDLTLIMSGSVEITIGAGKTNGTSEPFVYDPSVEIVLTEYQGGGYEKLVVEIIIINPPVLAEAEIAVDEALLKDGNAVNAGGHETLGTGSFTVNLYGEETGTVQIGGEGGCTVTLHNGADADISDAAVTVNGVKFNVTGVSQSGDNYTIYYSYELTGAQTHSDPEKVGENDTLKGSLDILLTNESGDTAKSTLLVLVYDDGPKVTIIEDASVNLIVDEADLDDGKIEHAAVTSEIVDAGSLFDVLPGADGESDRTYELSLFENGTVSGVIYKRNNDRHVVTDDDDSLVPESVIDECALKALYAGKVYDVILIKNENGTISGMIEFSQENEDTEQVEIFRVSIDGEGQVQLTEYRHLEVDGGASIYHVVEQTDDQGGTTETKVDVISLENMIAVTLTSQDNDGDTAAASVPVSLIFRDDEE